MIATAAHNQFFNPNVTRRGEEKEVITLRKVPKEMHGTLEIEHLVLIVKTGYLKEILFEAVQNDSELDYIASLASVLQKKLRWTHTVEISEKRKSGFDSVEIITIKPKRKKIHVRDKLRLAQTMGRKIEDCLKKELPLVESRPL